MRIISIVFPLPDQVQQPSAERNATEGRRQERGLPADPAGLSGARDHAGTVLSQLPSVWQQFSGRQRTSGERDEAVQGSK